MGGFTIKLIEIANVEGTGILLMAAPHSGVDLVPLLVKANVSVLSGALIPDPFSNANFTVHLLILEITTIKRVWHQ